jgi:hypothetical protein
MGAATAPAIIGKRASLLNTPLARQAAPLTEAADQRVSCQRRTRSIGISCHNKISLGRNSKSSEFVIFKQVLRMD